MTTLGLDIGGASIKAATSAGWADARRFPLWKSPNRLAEELALLTRDASFDSVAVTMTGELCDGFETKEEGVNRILDAVAHSFPDIPSIKVWQTTGAFCSLDQARLDAWKTGSANWLALATFAAGLTHESKVLLLDIGSTTTDIIPIHRGRPIPSGRTDPERLASGELAYHGIRRTPICSILNHVRLNGTTYPLMRELFATSLDAYLVLSEIGEDSSANDTSDSRAETIPFAVDRLARMIGSDRTRFSLSDARQLARDVRETQLADIKAAMQSVLNQAGFKSIDAVITSGEGEFLARRVAQHADMTQGAAVISLADKLSAETSRAACAYAVAMLAEQTAVHGLS